MAPKHITRFAVLAMIITTGIPPASADPSRPLRSFAPVSAQIVDAAGPVSALLHVNGPELERAITRAESAGPLIGSTYRSIGVFSAFGPPEAFRDVAASGLLTHIEDNGPIEYLTETSHKATRTDLVRTGRASNRKRYDGTGIGVAVVDTGVDATHPDLVDRVVTNLKAVCSTPLWIAGEGPCIGPRWFVPMDDTDGASAGGHGTHVAGTIAGTGAASKALITGAAPGASLHVISTGNATLLDAALDGLDWVLENHDKVKPRIRVVNNSWAMPAEYDPHLPYNGAVWKMQDALIEAGVVVVFGAGNSGGNGSQQLTSDQCINPTPGMICVGGYDDLNLGTRKGVVASFSSRGKKGEPRTYPDLVAPGQDIVATCRAHLPVCYQTNGRKPTDDLYAGLSGTSMATPHVSGIIALMLQANPRLTPAEVERILENTSYRSPLGKPYEPDPANPGSRTSFAWGHGLVDALAAIDTVIASR